MASGAYDMGFADLAALMEFRGNNPNAPNKPVAVMMVYNNTPAAVFALKKIGHQGAGRPDRQEARRAGFRCRPQGLPDLRRRQQPRPSKVNWTAWTRPLRETMLVRGDVDAITGFYFTSLLNLNARGVKDEDVVILPYPQYGVKLYGNAIIASEKFVKEKPEAVKAFLRAFTKGVKEVLADPKAAIKTVKARDGIIDEELELRRLKLAIEATVLTADAKAEGFGEIRGPRLCLMATQVSDAFGSRSGSIPPGSSTDGFLPAKAERNIFRRRRSDGAAAAAPASSTSARLARLQRGAAGQNEFAVEDINLKIGDGEFIAIVGPSGCGKSTFMKLATGLKHAVGGRS